MSEVMYTTGGTISANNPLYINRRADDELLELCCAGEYAYILTARQLGKSSLILRTSIRLRETGVRAVVVDLQRLGKQAVSAPQWFLGLIREVARGLALDANLLAWWQQHENLGMAQRMALFFEDLVLTHISQRVVIFIDEIDTTIGLTFADDFFVAIRALYEGRVQNPELKRLSFVLIGTAAPNDLISDPQRTPFNIGRRVDLNDFDLKEALLLAKGLSLPEQKARRVLEWVFRWTNGHPYLTQRLCRAIAEAGQIRWNRGRIDTIVAETFFGDKSQDSNLDYVQKMVLQAPNPPSTTELLRTYQQIRRSRRPVPDEAQSLVKSYLKLCGIVRWEHGALRVRHPIYQHVFDDRWIKEHLSITWQDRLRRVRRVALAIIVPLFILSVVLAGYAWSLASDANARRHDAETSAQTAVAAQAKAEIGQLEALNARATAEASEQAARSSAQTAVAAQATSDILGKTAATRALNIAVQSASASNPDLGLMIAIEGANNDRDNPEVKAILSRAIRGSHLRSVLQGHTDEVTAVAFSPDGKQIVTASTDNTARVWDWGGIVAQPLTTLQGHTKGIRSVTYSPDGQYIATASQDTTVRIWNAATGGAAIQTLQANTEPVYSVTFSPDGRLLVTASRDSTARIWDWRSGRLLGELSGHRDLINTAVFSPDGTRILTASRDKTARIWFWDSATGSGSLAATLSGHSSNVYSAAFSPDGSSIVTASQDGTARVWPSSGGEALILRENATSPALYSAAFSPDENSIVTASLDGTAQIWDLQESTDKPRTLLLGHTARIWSAAFSPDGAHIVTVSADSTGRVWAAGSSSDTEALPNSIDELIALARTRVTRELTPEEQQKYVTRSSSPTPVR
jgi:WD40 repeat protein